MKVLPFLLAFSMIVPVHAENHIVKTNHQKYSYQEMSKDIAELKKRYPKLIHVKKIGESYDHRQIRAVTMGNQKAHKVFVVIANLHAREYMTTNLVMKQIEDYAKAYQSDRKINHIDLKNFFSHYAISFIPTCNPDGMMISQQGFKAIRNKTLRNNLKKIKNPSKIWKANARGVDLNYNYSYQFIKKGKPSGNGYTGKKAFSEKENRALRDYLLNLKKKHQISGLLSYHATGSVIYSSLSKKAPKRARKGNQKMDAITRRMTGYINSDVLNQASNHKGKTVIIRGGYSRSYFNYTLKIPAITIEIGKKPCPLSIKEFPSIYKKNKALPLTLANALDH